MSEKWTKIHMSQSVSGPLRNWSAKQWNDATSWMTRDDGSKFASGEELKADFQKMADQGIERIPVGACDNFCPQRGCLGHSSDGPNTNHEKNPRPQG